MPVAVQRDWRSIAVGILRQELDSMLWVIYLLEGPTKRDQIIASSVSGAGFRAPRVGRAPRRVQDREMLDITKGINGLSGWTERVYEFGCKFIHLSEAHDYAARDPFQALPIEGRQTIVCYLHRYHDGDFPAGSASVGSTFDEIIAYAPYVLRKISDNLRYNLDLLRRRASAAAVPEVP